MLMILLLLPLLSVTLDGCGRSRSQIVEQQQDQAMRASAHAEGDHVKEEYTARAKRLDVASSATVPVAPLTTQDALEEYSSRLVDLQFLISSAEKDLIQASRSQGRRDVNASLNRAREALASGMITKGKAQLAMKDFEGARKTFLQVLVAFDPKVYGDLTRQAKLALRDVEKAADLARP